MQSVLLDLPKMNPYDWIVLLSIVSKDPIKYKPIFLILRRMIRGYIQEVRKLDVEIANKLNRKPIVKPLDQPEVFENREIGFIEKESWGIFYQATYNVVDRYCMLYLRDKHFYPSTTLINVLLMTEIKKLNKPSNAICVSNILRWWVIIRMILLKNILKVF